MKIPIRLATLADAGALARLHRSCFADAWDAEAMRRLMERDSSFALLAQHADATESQGFIVVQAAADESEILSLGSLPAARRAGIAASLLSAASAEAVRRGAVEMFLEVAEDNIAALALYARFGFAVTGRRHAYYVRAGGRAADAVTLRAALPLQDHGNTARSRLD